MRRFQNAALFVGALLAAWALIELIVFPPLVRHLPLRLHEHLDGPVRLLAQSAKSGTVPVDYIAVLGDSYAQGRGDWLLEADPDANPPFAAFHVLHQRLGRDVVSFGLAGAGSAGGLVQAPAGALAFLNSTLRYATPAPQSLVVMFYEGNDVQDNLRDLAIGLLRRRPTADAYQPGDLQRLLDAGAGSAAVIDRLMRTRAVGGSRWYREGRKNSWTNDLVFGRFALRAVVRTVVGAETELEGLRDRYVQDPVAGANAARIGGRVIGLPDGLQGPPLDLGAGEIALGLNLFERALHFLHLMAPEAALHVVYVPSPLACYELEGESVSKARYAQGKMVVEAARMAPASDGLASEVAAAAARQGAVFIDARPAIRARAEREKVHGPRDWEHFNRAGQEALADAIVRGLMVAPGR